MQTTVSIKMGVRKECTFAPTAFLIEQENLHGFGLNALNNLVAKMP